MKTEAHGLPLHLHSLDVLRGLGALSVVLFHWHHFFFTGTTLTDFDAPRQPFYSVLSPLYTHGWRAVELFFCLSGFIFYWLYSEKVANRKITLREFAALRFSRLYPLHLVTLLLVAAGQTYMLWRNGAYLCAPYNDLYHFGLHLAFASSWGFGNEHSFNFPVWSVSVEVLLYAVFFLTCRFNLRRWWHLVVFACLAPVVSMFGLINLSRGILCFFIGCIAFHLFLILRRRSSAVLLWALITATALMWMSILTIHSGALYALFKALIWNESWNVFGKDLVGAGLLILSQRSFELILFPLTIITVALWETRRGSLGKRLTFLGEISYSSYLLQFPLQLAFVALASAMSLPRDIFYSPITLAVFFAALIPISLLSYHFLERPCQSFLRGWLARPNRAAEASKRHTVDTIR